MYLVEIIAAGAVAVAIGGAMVGQADTISDTVANQMIKVAQEAGKLADGAGAPAPAPPKK